MAAYIKMEDIKGESTDIAPEDEFVFHPLTQVDDYTTEDPFDMAPPEGETLFHPYVASEDKAIGGEGATADGGDGGGDAGDIILWDIVDSIANGGDAAAGGGNDGDDLDIILGDIIDGVAASDDAPVEAGIAFHEPVIVEDFNIGGLLCDYG